MRFLAILLALATIAGCSRVDRAHMTNFTPAGEGQYLYVVRTDPIYPLESASAEAERIAWLGQYLTDNELCPAGYLIVDRTTLLVNVSLIGVRNYNVHYRIACRPQETRLILGDNILIGSLCGTRG